MRWFVVFMITSLVSIGIALLLSNFSSMNEKYDEARQNEIKSVVTTLEHKLSNQNLVDHMVELSLNLDVYRVGWSHAILSIDLILSNSQVQSSLIYNDLLEISQFGFSTMNNVNHVLIRVFEPESSDPYHVKYMLTMEARRDRWSSEQYDRFEQKEISAAELLRSQFSISFSQRWEEFIQNNF